MGKEKIMMKKSMLAAIAAILLVVITAPAFPAEELFDTASAAVHVKQGISLLHAKKYDAAIKEFEEAASINPDAEAYYYLGYTFYLKGRSGDESSREKSRENFAKAYEIDPNFSPTRFKPAEAPQSVVGNRPEEPANAGTAPSRELPQTQPTPSARP
jgi:tetratricopeptide (TPR) repeat protein